MALVGAVDGDALEDCVRGIDGYREENGEDRDGKGGKAHDRRCIRVPLGEKRNSRFRTRMNEGWLR